MMNKKQQRKKEIPQETIDRMFNDIMSLPENGIVDFPEMLDQMTPEERELTFKYALDITKLENEGKMEEEIDILIKQSMADYQAEMRDRGY